MGYRDRRAHKAQQQQQRMGKAYSKEQRVTLPAPRSMNFRDAANELGPTEGLLLENAFYENGGVRMFRAPQLGGAILASTSQTPNVGPWMAYYGSGSSSAEFWVIANGKTHRLTSNFQFWSDTTASIDSATIIGSQGPWIEFNKTIIYTRSTLSRRKWTRASSWTTWDASVSASASAANFTGLQKFKNRLFAWTDNSTILFYGSTDQIEGTFNPFDLGGVIGGKIRQVFTLPRDGGAGPDDYLGILSDQGDLAVYAGTDPADATDWSIVGTYRIGKPVSRDSWILHGNQVIVMCEDDFYFLPQDMVEKKQKTKGAAFRDTETFDGTVNAVWDREVDKIIWSDGTVHDPKRDYAVTTVKLMSADPAMLRQSSKRFWRSNSGLSGGRPVLGEFKGRTFVAPERFPFDVGTSTSQNFGLIKINPIFHRYGANRGIFPSKVRTAPIKTQGRTNISLIRPLLGSQVNFSAPTHSTDASGNALTASGEPFNKDQKLNTVYALGIEWDQYNRQVTSTSATLITATASGQNTFSDANSGWMSGFGTGHYAQLYFEVISEGDNQDTILYGFEMTVSDTGDL